MRGAMSPVFICVHELVTGKFYLLPLTFTSSGELGKSITVTAFSMACTLFYISNIGILIKSFIIPTYALYSYNHVIHPYLCFGLLQAIFRGSKYFNIDYTAVLKVGTST
jgi:hypothetical protein